MNRLCNVAKRVRTDAGIRYCPVVLSANGRITPDTVLVNGIPERHREGSYYLEFYEGTKRRRVSIGKDAADATARRLRKEAELNAKNNGVAVATESKNARRVLSAAISDYLEDTKLSRKRKTYAAYDLTLRYFAQCCSKMYVDEIERKDLLKFSEFLRDVKDQAPRSVYNKFENLMTFLKSTGYSRTCGQEDWPRFVEDEPEIYEKEDLDALFRACKPDERLWFEFFLTTGMREQEVMHTYWSDLNLNASIVRVSHKPDRAWTPKAYKEREIPIPMKLASALKAWKKDSDRSCNLLFPTAGCKPKLDFLDCLKAVAERAGLDKDNFWLHKFRATFATWSLWAGVDLRTVQSWLGHSDIESTMRYLKPSRSQQVREKVNAIFA